MSTLNPKIYNYKGTRTIGHLYLGHMTWYILQCIIRLNLLFFNNNYYIMIVFLVVCWREVVCLSCQSANSLASFPTPFYPRLHPFCSTLDQVTVMWQITFDKLLAARLFMWLKLPWSCKECYERRDLGMVPHDYSDNIRKWHFMCMTSLCEFIKTGLLINLCYFHLCILAFYALWCMVREKLFLWLVP